jgi:hypothetical protein
MNKKSAGYGIETVAKTFNGRTYQQIVFNESGKFFLLQNIEKILQFEKHDKLFNRIGRKKSNNKWSSVALAEFHGLVLQW